MHHQACGMTLALNILLNVVTNYSMSEARGTSIARLLIVIITVFGWFLISNHCVLAEFKSAPKAEAGCHRRCCGDQPPVKSKQESGVECCKTLRATLSGGAKDFVGYDFSLFALQRYFVGPVISANDSRATSRVLELDTGPPFANTFAESVLQRSILAHAPPFVV
jgi:hypothetical protein